MRVKTHSVAGALVVENKLTHLCDVVNAEKTNQRSALRWDSQNMSSKKEGQTKVHNVVVTGFGLFRHHGINPSWESIKDGRLTCNRADVRIITKQVNVQYSEVDKVVSLLWSEHNPLVMIHVGLSASEHAIRIEQLARHGPYIHDDVTNDAPHKDLRQYAEDAITLEEGCVPRRGFTCKPCEFGRDMTCIDVDKICSKMESALKEGLISIPVKKSFNAGLYVCEYIYHKSLQISDRTIFIHVPDVTNFELDQITNTLSLLVENIVEELLS